MTSIKRLRSRSSRIRKTSLTLQQQETLRHDLDVTTRMELAQNPCLSPRIQLLLTIDTEDAVRAGLAGNAALVPEAQEILSEDKTIWVLFSLIENPALTLAAQYHLACSPKERVRERLGWKLGKRKELSSALDLPARFVHEHLPEHYHHVTRHLDQETLGSLVENWSGHLASLVEACTLLQRNESPSIAAP